MSLDENGDRLLFRWGVDVRGPAPLKSPSKSSSPGAGASRSAFTASRVASRWWTDLEALYFSGYVLWNYAQLPFLLLWPGLTFEPLGTTKKRGEVWDKVGVTFPPEVATHSPKQVFYFGPDGLLRRHDYYVQIMTALARGARYIHQTQSVEGLILPSRIEIKLGLVGESSAPFPALGFVDFDATRIDWGTRTSGVTP